MAPLHVEVFARSSAPPDAVWRWLADASSWRDWTMLTLSELEREGEPPPDGVGAVRRFGRGGQVSREEVVAFEPPAHLAYVLRSGMPVRHYRADVHLSADGAGTLIVWRAEFEGRAGTGRAVQLFFRFVLGRFARGLARRAATSP